MLETDKNVDAGVSANAFASDSEVEKTHSRSKNSKTGDSLKIKRKISNKDFYNKATESPNQLGGVKKPSTNVAEKINNLKPTQLLAQKTTMKMIRSSPFQRELASLFQG